MSKALLLALLVAVLLGEGAVAAENRELHFKSPAPGMRFTAGTHQLTLNGFGREGPTRPPQQVMSVEVDPWPAGKKLVELKEDLIATDLDWTNVALRGNGHTIWAEGKLTIRNSLVTGLGSMSIVDPSNADANSVVMVPGITATLSGDVEITEGSDNILAEHNVLRSSSWPLQTFGGEFGYNLMVDAGHNWVRTLTSNTRFHHNVLVHTGDPYSTGTNAGVWLYNKRQDVAIYNNTFDGGDARDFDCPMISVSTGCSLSTLRNNVFTGVWKISSLANNAIVARGGKDSYIGAIGPGGDAAGDRFGRFSEPKQ